MSMAPETGLAPTAEAPADRPTTDLEAWAQQGIALLFGDRVLDQNERQILRGFLEEVTMRAEAGGGIGQGATPSPEAAGELPQTPQEMNADGAEDFGSGQGDPMYDEEA